MARRFFCRLIVLTVVIALGALSPADAKTLRVNINADPSQIDPITYSELNSYQILEQVYEGFTAITPDGRAVPALAESWSPLASGDGFRFKLRKGVKFHSGRPFTAKDVKYTFEQLLRPGAQGGLSVQYLANIIGADEMRAGKATELTGVIIVDDYTVDVSFTRPDVLFPIYEFFFMDSGIVGERGPDWMTKVDAGTGPFIFKKWERGTEVDLVANPDYWGGAPKISGVQFLIIPTGDTALSQYDAGELDLVSLPENAYRRALSNPDYAKEIIKVPKAQVRYMGMNQKLYAPFKDQRVREAISLSIDRDAMVKGLYNGAAVVLNGQTVPGIPGYNPGMPPLKYDPAQARALLAEAGFPDGKGLPPVEIQCTEPFKDEITYYANQFGKVLGMQVTPKVVERATFIKAMNAGEVAFFPWGWTADYPDAMTFLGEMWYSKSPFNRARWGNASFDKVIEEAQTETNDQKRFALYQRAEKILMEDWATAPLPATVTIALRKPNVMNATVTPFGYSVFQDAEVK
ncbi:MAG TPA: ABC transporter substrate-binding protein [Alphaproteobacteria bacterium]|nr:ABC transporter substrate-binding protein [Alphaproteobacteria bacterium]